MQICLRDQKMQIEKERYAEEQSVRKKKERKQRTQIMKNFYVKLKLHKVKSLGIAFNGVECREGII